MKRRLWILLGLMLVAAPGAPAQVPEAVQALDAGNQHYAAGDYRAALEAYEQVLASGYASGDLYLNMGNAYYRLDALGQAIRYYEKARRLMPESREVAHNLRIARSRAVDQFSEVPPPFWRVGWERAVAWVGVWGFFWVGLAGYMAALVLAGVRIWLGPQGAWHRRALTLAALVGTLGLAAAFGASLHAATDRSGVVVADEAALREAPQEEAPAPLVVHEGLVVDILEEAPGWLAVRLPNGATGWLPQAALAEI